MGDRKITSASNSGVTVPAAKAAAPAAQLVLQGVTLHYGAVTALAGVDLAVAAGEFLTILGPSGSGKTSLLKVVAGFEMPDAGTVSLAGRDITTLAPAKRGIGMVFQNYALFPHMSAGANVAFPLTTRRLGRAAIQEKVAATLALVGLAGYEDRMPRALSGGQQQRVALARAIVFDPDLLLLDEPFGALDRKLRTTMQQEIRSLQRRLGITTLFVTHDQEEALLLSDRIAVMNEGRIAQLGTPETLYRRPENRFVAEFLGEANLFRGRAGTVTSGIAEVKLETGGTMRVAVPPDNRAVRPGADLALVLRPDRPRLLEPDETADNTMHATVADAAYLGDAFRYRLALDDGGELTLKRPAGDIILSRGARVRLGWSASDMSAVPW